MINCLKLKLILNIGFFIFNESSRGSRCLIRLLSIRFRGLSFLESGLVVLDRVLVGLGGFEHCEKGHDTLPSVG